jgi:hypothetical protein
VVVAAAIEWYNGNLYIADTYHFAVRVVTPDGIINTVAGNGTASMDGPPRASTWANRAPSRLVPTAPCS